MSQAEETSSPLEYANPLDLPPNGATATVQACDGDTLVIIPPERKSRAIMGGIVLCLLVAWPVLAAKELVLQRRVVWTDWLIFITVSFVTFCVFGLAAWHLRLKARYPIIIRANRDSLLLVRPAIVFRKREWKVADVGPLAVTFGSPSVNGRMTSNLCVGNWIKNRTVVAARDKAELIWIARALNRAMGKE